MRCNQTIDGSPNSILASLYVLVLEYDKSTIAFMGGITPSHLSNSFLSNLSILMLCLFQTNHNVNCEELTHLLKNESKSHQKYLLKMKTRKEKKKSKIKNPYSRSPKPAPE